MTDGQGQWVVRLNGDDAGINRSNEMSAIMAAYHAGIAPGVAFNGQDYLVVEYLSGEKPRIEDIAEIGTLFANIHSLDVSIQPMDLLKHLETYHRQIAMDEDVDFCYEKITSLQPLKKCRAVFCHQDLTLDNMIRTSTGIAVIDWEYAAMSDPAYDLAVFSYTHELTQVQFSDLLENYSREEIDLSIRVRYFMKVYALIEILWWIVRGTKPEEKIEKLKAILEDQ